MEKGKGAARTTVSPLFVLIINLPLTVNPKNQTHTFGFLQALAGLWLAFGWPSGLAAERGVAAMCNGAWA